MAGGGHGQVLDLFRVVNVCERVADNNNTMTTGIVESLNVVLKNVRDLPALQLVKELRNLLKKWFVTRQQQAMLMST